MCYHLLKYLKINFNTGYIIIILNLHSNDTFFSCEYVCELYICKMAKCVCNLMNGNVCVFINMYVS